MDNDLCCFGAVSSVNSVQKDAVIEENN